ncbi:ubiquinone biosynthesis monooxygenase COQ6, mitochondrial isoform X2 [Apis florea]|uniref:ubiquinone biosynthesis monooxygenase COQ6, mitochondrial isoform X2 n=1 Tax=Apis florea TaxID=7463 RepID=UPI0012FEC790|nr:ubiquinone biosynthesis monooxygenase COQ6, mitochondrial isoform X2 [Apis florea]
MALFGKAMTYCDVLALTLKRCKYIISNGSMLTAKPFSISTQNNENYDIIITGGGMVGSTLACAIANNRKLECKKILLLESNKQHEYKSQEKYSNRVVALNKQTRCLLSSIGAWQHIEAIRYSTVRKMQVWDACSDAMIIFNEDYLTEEIAYIVENDLLLHAVNKQLTDKENVNIIYNSKVENIKLPKTQEENAVIQLQDGTKYKSKLLIGADGVNSLVRRTMDTQYVKWNYNQMGIVATLKLSELTNELSSLVWSLPIDEAKRLLKVSEEEFVDNINNALWKVYPKDGIVESGMKALQQLLEGFSLQTGVVRQLQPSVSAISEGSRAAFPLQFGHSVSYVQTGTVLVGDAAHRVHPLAGQGVNLGFGDITVLVQLLAEAVISGVPIGNIMYLRKYETLRQRYNVPIMFAIDALHRLYNGTAAPIVLVRSLGLQLTNAIPVIKKALIEHASGQIET